MTLKVVKFRIHSLTVSVLGQYKGYTVNYTPFLKELPRAKLEETPKGKGVYLIVYTEASPNTDII